MVLHHGHRDHLASRIMPSPMGKAVTGERRGVYSVFDTGDRSSDNGPRNGSRIHLRLRFGEGPTRRARPKRGWLA